VIAHDPQVRLAPPSAALRFLTKYKLPLEALQAQDEAALNELLKSQIPEEIDASLAAAARAIDTAMARR